MGILTAESELGDAASRCRILNPRCNGNGRAGLKTEQSKLEALNA